MLYWKLITGILLLLPVSLAGQGAGGTQTLPRPMVTVALIEGYPAFQTDSLSRDGRAAIELRAIIYHHNPHGGQGSLIVLNPEHANPETLVAALRASRFSESRVSSEGEVPGPVVIRADRVLPAVPAARRRVLEVQLSDLNSRPVEEIKFRTVGRRIVITNTMSPE